ncbi:gliding motility protein [Aquirufa sp.]|jgi:hypothetical protein|uniref:gliding motility protein GldB-related protein n=1 Tax=Aquirufa sp. TaxID=2676249 RepID=UPI0037C14FAA
MKYWFALFIGFCFASCSSKKEDKVPALPEIKWDMQRLDRSFANASSALAVDSILKKHPEIAVGYFSCPPEKTPLLARDLYQLFNNPALRKFYDQSQDSSFFGGGRLEKELKIAFQRVQKEFPGMKTPKIRTVFSGFGGLGSEFTAQHLQVSDSLIVIGLDFFMGKKGLYLPPNVYDYQMRRLEPRALVGQVMLQYSAFLNKQNEEDHSLLSDMIWYGKGYAFTKTIVPEVADSLLFGYTAQELLETNAFQKQVWEYFIDKKLLFNKEELIKSRYLGERPKTPEIGPACPGSIGRWVGYTIVQHYWAANPKLSISKIMADQDFNRIFLKSAYRGEALKTN